MTPSNDFSPTWIQILEEFGVERFMGRQLRKNLEEIFSQNQITPSTALEEIQTIANKIKEFKNSFSQIISGFAYLNIGEVELESSQCEIGVLVPREYVENDLKKFGKELQELSQIFNVFAEIVTGSRPGFKIREISSSDLTVFLGAATSIGWILSKVLESLLNSYQKVLDIKKAHHELKKLEVPDENTKGVEKYCNELMEKAIEKLVPELINKFYKNDDKGRENELKIELDIVLRKMANRIDNGFNIEVRVEPPAEEGIEDLEEEEQENIKIIKEIESSSKTFKFIRDKGEPILSLPESKPKEAKGKDKKS